MGRQDIRPIGHAEVQAFYGFEVPAELVARGGFLNGELAAVWGLAWIEPASTLLSGPKPPECWLFWNMRPDARRFMVTIWREAGRLLAAARQAGETVFSVADNDETAPRLHERLGAVPAGRQGNRVVWVWRV